MMFLLEIVAILLIGLIVSTIIALATASCVMSGRGSK
jgi:hypothetical protein